MGYPSRLLVEPLFADKKVLIPLTSSLYVPGKIKDTDNVIVDIGTGYFVEKVSLSLPFIPPFSPSHSTSLSRHKLNDMDRMYIANESGENLVQLESPDVEIEFGDVTIPNREETGQLQ